MSSSKIFSASIAAAFTLVIGIGVAVNHNERANRVAVPTANLEH